MELNKKVLLGTIGYHNLSNHSLGPVLMEKIGQEEWSTNISVEEMNWGPIAIVQWFESMEIKFERVVLLAAIERKNRSIGEYTLFKWGGKSPSETEIQARIGDAVTGVISAENLLIIGEHFKIWPEEVFILDVEPGPEKAGMTLTPEVEDRITQYLDILKDVCFRGAESKYNFVNLFGNEITI